MATTSDRHRWRSDAVDRGRRVARVARRIRAAARAHDSSVPRVALRTWRMTRQGWYIGDLALLGLLDPRLGPERERWAVRRAEFERLQELLNPSDAVPLVEDKERFARSCADLGLPTPAVAAVLRRSSDRETTARDWSRQMQERAVGDFVVKPISGQRGIGVHVLRRTADGVDDMRGGLLTWDELVRRLEREPHAAYLVQRRVPCHPSLRDVSASEALQSVRVVTLVGADERPQILYSLLRIAVGSTLTDGFRAEDSSSTGNLIARVDDAGRLARPVAEAPGGFGLARVDRHPVTGFGLTGWRVPEWESVRALALEAAAAFPPLRTVGWDIAPTPGGAVLIEGNAWWGLSADPDGALLPVRAALQAAAGSPAATRQGRTARSLETGMPRTAKP